MQKGIKFRIYPNREQQKLINQTLGCCRLIYNKGLAMRKEAYKNGKKIGYSQTSAMLTELKKCEDFAFLKVADSIALQQSLRDLDRGFVNFFQKRAAHISVSWEDISNSQNLDWSKYASLWKLVKNLAVRIWECPDCHTVHDMDINASKNILKKGLQMRSA